MPKRKQSINEEFDYLKRKLKKLESKFNKPRRSRIRVIDSSSSSSSQSSRESTPSRQNLPDGEMRSALSTEDLSVDKEVLTSLLDDHVSMEQGSATFAQNTSPPDEGLDTVVLEILGDDPSDSVEYGPEIYQDLAKRFEHIATHGLDPAQRKELLGRYKIRTNCTLIGAPILNAEIKATLPDNMAKRDRSMEVRQKQLAATISCLGSAITDQLSADQTNINQHLLKKLMDIGRLLCDMQSTDSISRRNFATYYVKKDMKEHLSHTKIDKFLFGENLSETLRFARAVNKSGTDLKVQQKVFKKVSAPHSSKLPPKNWKPQAPARRPPGPPPRSREPAYLRSQHATSSRRWSPPQPPTRRR